MGSSSIQFKGIDGVLNAYENREVAPWSLWQGKQFMFKYEGKDITEGAEHLRQTLELLGESSNAVYTLKVYEDFAGKIKSNTPDDGSFNFKINGEEQALTQAQYSTLRNSNAIAERLERIEARLNEREEEEEEEEPSRLGVIGEIISHPAIQPLVQGLLSNVLGIGKASESAPQMQRAAIAGVHDDAKIMEAVNDLKQHDTKLAEHLAKLAELAKTSPDSFKFLIATLDNMQL